MTKRLGMILVACALALAMPAASAQEKVESYGMARGWMMSDGRNVAINGAAVGYGNKAHSYYVVVELMNHVTNFNDDISVAFWPPTVCTLPSGKSMCSFSHAASIPNGASIAMARIKPPTPIPVSQR